MARIDAVVIARLIFGTLGVLSTALIVFAATL
jgi:hypothetical protein